MKEDLLLLALPFLVLLPLWFLFWATHRKRQHPPSPEALEAAAVLGDARWLPSGLAAVVFLFVYGGAELVRRVTVSSGALKMALIAAPVLAFVWFSYAFLREFRGGDEFERRVQGEASAQALWLFMLWSVGMWVMSEMWPTYRFGTFSPALGFLPLCYAVGMFIARGKYVPAVRVK